MNVLEESCSGTREVAEKRMRLLQERSAAASGAPVGGALFNRGHPCWIGGERNHVKGDSVGFC